MVYPFESLVAICKYEDIGQSMDDRFTGETVVRRENGGRVDIEQPEHAGRGRDPSGPVTESDHVFEQFHADRADGEWKERDERENLAGAPPSQPRPSPN